MKKFLLLLLSLTVFQFSYKKDDAAQSNSSNDVKYEWTSETSSKFSAAWTENAVSPIMEEFTGKSWSKSFKSDAGQNLLNFSISSLSVVENPNTTVKGTIKIYVGGKEVKTQAVTLNSQIFYVMLTYYKPN